MTEPNKEAEIETAPVPSVGEQLRAVREEKKLTIAEVASQLRLVRGNIKLLEQGDWEQLHGRAYARGYFTSYVKFLGLPEEEMLEAFNAEYSATVAEPKLNAGSEKKRSTSVKYTLAILALILLAWISYPQWSHYFDTERELFKNTEQTEQAEQTQTPVKDEQPEMMTETNPSGEAEIQSVIEPIEAVEKNDAAVSEQVSGETEQQSNMENQIPVEVDNKQPQSEILNSQPSADNANNEESDKIKTELAESTSQQVAQGTEQNQLAVELYFSDDCWIKITDAEGKTLLNKIMPANSQQTVTGTPPFNFSLGRSSAVSMKVNGQIFDMAPYQKREVVHFTVEQPVS